MSTEGKTVEIWLGTFEDGETRRIDLVQHDMTYGTHSRGLRLLWSFRFVHGKRNETTDPKPFFSRQHARQVALSGIVIEPGLIKVERIDEI